MNQFLREELSNIFEEEIARLRADDLLRKTPHSTFDSVLEHALTLSKHDQARLIDRLQKAG